ncbi:MAG: hypothetical protein ABIQ64_01605 [Candidatus Saccharimonadales bacterium]
MNSTIILLFALVIVVGLALLMFMMMSNKRHSKLNLIKYQQDWASIKQSITSDNKTQQFAIIQADKLLDKALKESGFAGTTMAERMTSASRVFSQREAVWTAHKLRNRIAHDSNARIHDQWAKKAMASFERALKDLGAL